MNLLILDADGVFMDEMPYWKTALATALDLRRLAGVDTPWASLAEACLVARRLQAITKWRGCNSNWDFAAVMTKALHHEATRSFVARSMSEGDTAAVAAALDEGMQAQWRGPAVKASPLSGFGIDRDGTLFEGVVERFQAIFTGERDVGWAYERNELAAAPDVMHATLSSFDRFGFTLGVCTSRTREETVGPMTRFDILDYFDADRIVTHDEVLEGEARTGIATLGKPHWFALAVAAFGMDAAVRAVASNDRLDALAAGDRLVYVGDAPADFQLADEMRSWGAFVEYAHVDSGVTSDDALAEIRTSSMTLGVVPDLAGVAALLGEGGA